MAPKRHFAAWLAGSPAIKTIASILDVTLSGVLSGAFIVEITTSSGLNWANFYRAPSFYGLMAVGILTYAYHRVLYTYERDILRFADDEFCLAFMRSHCLPIVAERYNEMIRAGDIRELERVMAEIKRNLK